jgi:hypothetical protein
LSLIADDKEEQGRTVEYYVRKKIRGGSKDVLFGNREKEYHFVRRFQAPPARIFHEVGVKKTKLQLL